MSKTKEIMEKSDNIEQTIDTNKISNKTTQESGGVLHILRKHSRKLGIICITIALLAIALIVVAVVVHKSISKYFILSILPISIITFFHYIFQMHVFLVLN